MTDAEIEALITRAAEAVPDAHWPMSASMTRTPARTSRN